MTENSGEMVTPSRQELRQFSKAREAEISRKHPFAPRSAFERQTTAEAIRRERRGRDRASSGIAALRPQETERSSRLQQHTQEATILQHESEALQQQIADQETSLVKRIVGHFRPQILSSVEERAEAVGQRLALSEKDLDLEQRLYEDLKRQMRDLEEAKTRANLRAQQRLNTFYEDTTGHYRLDKQRQENKVALEAHKKEHGSVEEAIREFSVYFVHATNPLITNGWGNNPFLREGIDWTDKVALVIAKKPALSASSIKQNSPAKTWADIGTVLNGGIIHDASPYDHATQVRQAGERASVYSEPETNEEYRSRVRQAAQQMGYTRNDGYNEYVIAHPQTVGLFINLDKIRLRERNNTERQPDPNTVYQSTHFPIGGRKHMAYADVFAAAETFQLPVFVFDLGTAYRVTFDPETRSMIKGERVTPQEMSALKYTPPDIPIITEKAKQALIPEALV
ncbi:MAG: hypothetical protein HY431_00800 [Candidatus Levybacteria bacterium]|nr:hypothetical protein [Candidatus Levybacteria bacterium]